MLENYKLFEGVQYWPEVLQHLQAHHMQNADCYVYLEQTKTLDQNTHFACIL